MSPTPSGIQVDVVRVFCDGHGEHGNALGVVVDGGSIPEASARQEIAFELGFSETVFVDDAATGGLRIFTPATELPLAGHPLVGTAWLLAHRGTGVAVLRPPAGPVQCGTTGDTAWIEADPAWSPPWRLQQLASPEEVDAIDAEARAADGFDYVWAWRDELAGVVRSRSFVKEHGIVEDEATGSAALMIGALLGRPVRIEQGRGSEISAEPVPGGLVRVSGRVVFDHTLTLGG